MRVEPAPTSTQVPPISCLPRWWDRAFGRDLDDSVVWICACIDPIDDGIERVS
jgi:hypothetical protein